MGQGNAKVDLEKYRKGYPDMKDDPNINENYLFYSGKIPSSPDGDYIDKIHTKWWGRTDILEVHHGYIQWLFPIKEHGLNFESKPLQSHEIEKIKADPECIKRFVKSYEMILHFYGCRILDPKTGELDRHDEWKTQYRNLNSHAHNFLRITRILKCLGELGFEHYKKPFLEHFIKEIWVNKVLINCADSCEDYWIGTLKNDTDRKELEEKVVSFRGTRKDHDRLVLRSNHLPQSNLKASFSSANYSESTTSSVDEVPIDEEGKQELRKGMLARSEDIHSSHDDDGDDDGSGTLDLTHHEFRIEDVQNVYDSEHTPVISVTQTTDVVPDEGASNSDGSNNKQSLL